MVISRISEKSHHFVYPSGRSRILHLLRCQGVRGKQLQLHPWTPWIYSILDLCSVEVRPALSLLAGENDE